MLLSCAVTRDRGHEPYKEDVSVLYLVALHKILGASTRAPRLTQGLWRAEKSIVVTTAMLDAMCTMLDAMCTTRKVPLGWRIVRACWSPTFVKVIGMTVTHPWSTVCKLYVGNKPDHLFYFTF